MFEKIKPEKNIERSGAKPEHLPEERFGLLDKTKRNIWRLSRVCVLLGSLAMPGIAKELPAQETGQPQIEAVENRAERNRKLLRKNEYVVPQNILSAWAQAVDPRVAGIPAGAFLEYDYLNTKEKNELFSNALKTLHYPSDQIRNFMATFKRENNIIFSDSALNSPDFTLTLSHERMHKYISELPPNEQGVLNIARDVIIVDYNRRHEIRSNASTKVYEEYRKKPTGTFSMEDYKRAEEQAIESIEQDKPIWWRETYEKYELQVRREIVLAHPNEFYAYLVMGGLEPEIESYIEERFPESADIYRGLATRIKTEIEEASK